MPITDPPRGNRRDKFYLYCRALACASFGTRPRIEAKWFAPHCAIRNVATKYPPTILTHGTADTNVPYSLSKEMDATSAKAGVAHELIPVDGADHRLAGAKPEG